MAISATQVKEFRDRTGAPFMLAKSVLEESGGDFQKAVELLRTKAGQKGAKLGQREAKAGRVVTYVHFNGKLAALVEINCETDFVANTPDFLEMAQNVALHIACNKPQVVTRAQVPAELVEKEKALSQDAIKGKPPEIAEKIIAGKLEKGLYMQMCLMDQPFCNEEKFKGTIDAMVKGVAGKLGENIVVRRFAWSEVGVGGGASL
ncbi:MAG: elongation factor [Planctomycetota bacterium]|nr:MAG: elongation factor [Planctomycetota bacterium]